MPLAVPGVVVIAYSMQKLQAYTRKLKGRTLAITGIGGFIGSRLARRAAEIGMVVRGLDREPSALARLRSTVQAVQAAGSRSPSDLRLVNGDVNDPGALQAAFEGSHYVVHTAAVVSEAGPWELFRRVNVEGSRQAVRAAEQVRVRRFVQLSSVMVYGFDFPPDVNEDGPRRADNHPYCGTKIESEAAVLAEAEAGSIEVVIVRPGDVYGAGSVPWVLRPIRTLRQGTFLYVDGGRGVVNPVYVDNLIDGIFAALAAPKSKVHGQAFNITDGRAISFREYAAWFQQWTGRRLVVSLPGGLARVAFGITAALFRMLGRIPPAYPSAVDYLSRRNRYSIDRAREVLGFEPRISLEAGMELTRQGLVAAGEI